MFDIERQNQIKEILSKEKSVTVNDLAKKLFVSTATVRRDLHDMELNGIVERTHGGAVLKSDIASENAFFARQTVNILEKRLIAQKAIKFITSNQTLFFDSSSTVCALIPFLNSFTNLSITTNGIKTAFDLSRTKGVNVFSTGGRISPFSNSMTGYETVNSINSNYYDVAFLSCSGISLDGVITEMNSDNSVIKKTACKNADKTVILCSGDKFGARQMVKTFTLEDIDAIITDKTPPEEFIKLAEKHKVQVILAK